MAEDDEAGMISSTTTVVQNGHHAAGMQAATVVSDPPKEAMAAPQPPAQPSELEMELKMKEMRIQELESQLKQRDSEIVELRSHLDKFQSVFPYHVNVASPKHKPVRARKQRAQGISAEPQSESTLQELAQQTFPTFEKDER